MTENKQNSVALHYDLDDDQVEALVSAIEASPITSNGETSEVAIQAALFLTGDRPADREQDFIDVLVEVDDVSSLEKERAAFARILSDFATSTEGENAPQVLQTKQRLARIVSLLEQSIQYLNKSLPAASKTVAGDKQTDKSTMDTGAAAKQQRSVESVSKDDNDDDENDKQATSSTVVKSCSIFDANWFRFAAFSIVAVVLLLAVVALIQWLRKKYESDEKEQQQQQQQKQRKSADAGFELLKDSGSIML